MWGRGLLLLEAAKLDVRLALREGRHFVPINPDGAPARLAVPERATAAVEVYLGGDGERIRVSSARAEFTPPLRIKNGCAAFEPETFFLTKFFLDLLGDFEIDRAVANPSDGRIDLDAHKRLFFGTRFQHQFSERDRRRLPRLPVPLLPPPASLAAGSSPPSDGLRARVLALIDDVDLDLDVKTRLVENLAPAILAPFSLGLVTAHCRARATRDDDALLVVIDPPAAPQVECDLLRVALEGRARVNDLSADADLRAVISMREESIVVTPSDDVRIPITFDDGATLALQGSLIWRPGDAAPRLVDRVLIKSALSAHLPRGGMRIGIVPITVVDSEVRVTGTATVTQHNRRVELKARKLVVSARIQDPGVAEIARLGGVLSMRFLAEHIVAAPNGVAVAGVLHVQVELANAAKAIKRSLPLSFALHGTGTLAASSLEGILDAFEEFVDLNGDVSKVRDPSKPAVGAAGSDAIAAVIAGRGSPPLRPGNRATLLVDGVRSYARRLDLIDQAERSILVQALIFHDDRTGGEIANRLCARARAGVDVRVIIDDLSNLDLADPVASLAKKRPLYDRLEQAGVKLLRYNGITALLKQPPDTLHDLSSAAALLESFQPTSLGDPRAMLRAVVGRLGTVDGGERRLDMADVILVLKSVAVLNHRWHEKYMIFDGRVAIMGGLNIGDEYFLGGTDTEVRGRPAWRDTDVEIEGPAVADIHESFADNWRTITGHPLAPIVPPASVGTIGVQILQHRPYEDRDHHIQNAILEHLVALKPGERAWFANAYFLPTGGLRPLRRALIAAARRGVDVRVVTNSASTTDLPLINYAAIFSYRDLIGAGVKIFERRGERTMHSKFCVLGARLTAIGSWNMDNRSESLNSEGVALIYDDAFADGAARVILDDMHPDVAAPVELGKILSQPVTDELRSVALSAVSEFL